MKNCLVTKLKSVVNNDTLHYLDKGVAVFDNSLYPEQSNQVNTLGIKPTTNIICKEGVEFKKDSNYIRMSTETTPSSKYHFFYNLLEITTIIGAQGVDYRDKTLNFTLDMFDIVRCKNLTVFKPTSMIVVNGELNIKNLGVLTKLSVISIAGKYEESWYGDAVELADELLANGLNYTSNPVLVMIVSANENTPATNKIRINGNRTTVRCIHTVFTQNGYSIYNIATMSALNDYSGYTPVYTK